MLFTAKTEEEVSFFYGVDFPPAYLLSSDRVDLFLCLTEPFSTKILAFGLFFLLFFSIFFVFPSATFSFDGYLSSFLTLSFDELEESSKKLVPTR